VLQRLRTVLSELGSVAIPPPAQKTFDAEGEASFDMLPSRRNAKEIIRTLFRRCGKL
jgi:hypothetical protein